MGKKKGNAAPKAPKAPKVAGQAPKLGAVLAQKAGYAAKVITNIGKVVDGRGVAATEIQTALTAINAVQAVFAALPPDWKRPRLDGKTGTGAFAAGAAVQLKEKHAPKYAGALPATGLEVVAVAGTLIQVKLAGADGAACAFIPRAHLEAAKEAAAA